MQFRFLNFTLWFLAYFIGLDILSDMLSLFQQGEVHWWWESNPIILVTGFIIFYTDALIVYTVLYKWFKKIGVPGIALAIVLLFPVMIGFRFFVEEVLCEWLFATHNYNLEITLGFYFIDNLYFTTIYIAFGILYFFIRHHRYREALDLQLAEQNKKAELDFLQSQINPHFLFNNFNSIYSLVYSKSDLAIPAFDRMNELLRYGLYEKDKMVPVAKEVSYVENYIELQKLRYDYPLFLDVRLQKISDEIVIPPLILIPFVENAFKHGSFRNESETMQIHLKVEDRKLVFIVSNVIRRENVDSTGGLGLNNVRRRLELIYGELHQLEITEQNNRFEVKLSIKL